MMKKLILLILAINIATNVLAVPSVHKLGASIDTSMLNSKVSSNTTAMVNNVRASKLTPIKSTVNTSITNSSNNTNTSINRAPTAHKIGKSNIQTSIGTNSTQSQTRTDISSNEFIAVKNKVETLENTVNTMPKDVVTTNGSTNGYYVVDVDKEGTNITVTKTNTVVLPVKKSTGEADTGNAEIWIVRD